MKPVLMNSH